MSKKSKPINTKTPFTEPKTDGIKVAGVSHKNDEQKECLRIIHNNLITFISGVAGSGKTHLSLGYCVGELLRNKCHRIIISRPYIFAGPQMGYLSGDAQQKFEPLTLPVMAILSEMFEEEELSKLFEDKRIIFIPVGHLRGVSFKNSLVIVDEAQNLSPSLTRLITTRISDGSKIILNGDLRQSDINEKNGLQDAIDRLQDIEQIGFCDLKISVRHPLIEEIEKRYNEG